MRILFVNSFYMPEVGGGAELTLHRLVTEAHRRGHEAAVLTTGEQEEIRNEDGITIYRFPIDNAFRKLARELPGKFRRTVWQWRDRHSAIMAQRLERVIIEFQPDIVQFHNLPGITRSVWNIPKLLNVKSVQVLHDLNVICPNSSMFKNGRSCERQCASCFLFRQDSPKKSESIDAVVGVSNFVLNKVVAGRCFGPARKHVIYNAQHLPPHEPLPEGSELIFGYVGALSPAKGVEWLINEFDDAYGQLKIAGTGARPYVEHLKQLADGKNITFVGHVNPVQFFQGVHVAVVPSIWSEALGGVAIEANSVGRPVIASRRGGLPEVVKDGETGLLVDPEHPRSLGLAMKALSTDMRLLRFLSDSAPQGVSTFTNFARFANEYEAMWQQVISV